MLSIFERLGGLMAKVGGLGKGLDSLFIGTNSVAESENVASGTVSSVRLSDIEPDKNQPRTHFDNEALTSLAESISRHGILQPLVVRRLVSSQQLNSDVIGEKFVIISGERRWRAAKMAGLNEVPVVVKELSDSDIAAIMLVENLQREDLNAVEQAKGLQRLINDFSMTQEQAASVVGISRSALANSLRLLSLPEDTLVLLEGGEISAGHARALLSLYNDEQINYAARLVVSKELSVRETEKLVKNMTNPPVNHTPIEDKSTNAYFESLEERITGQMGRKVKICVNKKDKKAGKLELEYYNNEDFENLLKFLCGNDIFINE